ncbi:MAG: acyl carrier protein [Patescibacteria group bacterium]
MPPTVFERVAAVLINKFHVEPAKITLDARTGLDLGLDLFDEVELIFELEDEFGIKLMEDALENDFRTVGKFVEHITAQITPKT